MSFQAIIRQHCRPSIFVDLDKYRIRNKSKWQWHEQTCLTIISTSSKIFGLLPFLQKSWQVWERKYCFFSNCGKAIFDWGLLFRGVLYFNLSRNISLIKEVLFWGFNIQVQAMFSFWSVINPIRSWFQSDNNFATL